MQNTSTFQLILLIIFGVFLALGVLLFAGVIPGFQKERAGSQGAVILWGTINEEALAPVISNINREHSDEFSITYEEKDPATYEDDLIEALAASKGPDLFELPQELIVRHADKTFHIPFDSYSERLFKTTFVEAGEMYMAEDGIVALPVALDPMVMYWNRDMFARAGIASPPSYWDEFLTLAPKLSVVGESKNIVKSALGFGEFGNVTHAGDVLAALVLQAGNDIVAREGGRFDVVFSESDSEGREPAESALRFYTDFSNPSKPTYSWNRALPPSRDMFARGDLAVYFGYASEREELYARNPHLNMDVTRIPQIRDEKRELTFGRISAFAVSKNSQKINAAISALYALSAPDAASQISAELLVPPARRDLLSETPKDAFSAVFYDSALIARGFFDPNPKETYTIWKEMVENVSSGRLRPADAVSNAADQMNRALGR